jgi:Fe-S cluster assembly protein SufB
MTNQKKKLNFSLNKSYKYGFILKHKTEKFPQGLTKKQIILLSLKKLESFFILEFRLKAFKKWQQLQIPNWANLILKEIDFKKIIIYIKTKEKHNVNLKNKFKLTFQKLGLNITSNIALDFVFDSLSVLTTLKTTLAKQGIIFCSITEAIQCYPNLIKLFLGTIVTPGDNFFTALNSAAFSDGSFCYIPQNTTCSINLSTYFRINNQDIGQFERTLIIVEKNGFVHYIEGCTASKTVKNQLHAAIVELITFKKAQLKYSTIQNWYSGNSNGLGGIYNFVTKRGLLLGIKSTISWVQIETGSAITWKYPSCILVGTSTLGEFYSISLTKNYQQVDTGTKMIHLGSYTKSKIIVKGISCGFSTNSYRGLVKITKNAQYSRNFSQCDSFLLGSTSIASTYPYIISSNSTSIIEHEAKISKVGDDQLFYLVQRGINIEEAINLLISGFCKKILLLLPMEYALEANNLLNLKLTEI